MNEQPVTIPPLALDEEPMSKADVDFEKVRWDAKWHALQALCEVTKLGKADPKIIQCLHSIASQIANL